MNKKNAWATYTREQTKAAYDFSENYMLLHAGRRRL